MLTAAARQQLCMRPMQGTRRRQRSCVPWQAGRRLSSSIAAALRSQRASFVVWRQCGLWNISALRSKPQPHPRQGVAPCIISEHRPKQWPPLLSRVHCAAVGTRLGLFLPCPAAGSSVQRTAGALAFFLYALISWGAPQGLGGGTGAWASDARPRPRLLVFALPYYDRIRQSAGRALNVADDIATRPVPGAGCALSRI